VHFFISIKRILVINGGLEWKGGIINMVYAVFTVVNARMEMEE
jgi:hypothetical protein